MNATETTDERLFWTRVHTSPWKTSSLRKTWWSRSATTVMSTNIHRQLPGPRRGGKGKRGAKTKSEDVITDLFVANTHTPVFIFTNQGKVFKLKVGSCRKEVPVTRKADCKPGSLSQGRESGAILPIKTWNPEKCCFRNAKRADQKTALDSSKRLRGIIAIKLLEGDDIVSFVSWARSAHPPCNRLGQSIRFQESDARVMGRRTHKV